MDWRENLYYFKKIMGTIAAVLPALPTIKQPSGMGSKRQKDPKIFTGRLRAATGNSIVKMM